MEPKTIERFGGLLKEEPLTCIESEILLKNTCVLESVSPFIGYYKVASGPTKPLYLYLMLAGHHHFEEIQRAILHVKGKTGFNFDAAYSEITLPGYPPCESIRIRHLHDYTQIALLQQYFLSESIRFKRKTKKIESVPGLIRLEKFFCLEKTDEDIFIDKMELHHGYFLIPEAISWKKFVALTNEVKYDTDLLFFDAAQAFIFEESNIIDLVRIYRENLTLEKLRAIRDRYLKLFTQYC
jgi:hypothetical protein